MKKLTRISYDPFATRVTQGFNMEGATGQKNLMIEEEVLARAKHYTGSWVSTITVQVIALRRERGTLKPEMELAYLAANYQEVILGHGSSITIGEND